MLNFIKNKLTKIFNTFGGALQTIFSKNIIDRQTLNELEQILLQADVGTKTTKKIISSVQAHAEKKELTGQELKNILKQELINLLKQYSMIDPAIIMMVGINGSGKTTVVGKIAYQLTKESKKVLLVAADTFRAAAQEQLQQWALKSNVNIIIGKEGQDPSSVIYTACQEYVNNHYDCMIIDTAGRLQTKVNLMQELAKMKRTVLKQLLSKKITTLLTIDALLGQNSFEQAKLFNECTQLDALILTKMDGTSKGGIIFAINNELSIPICMLSYGEKIEDIKQFNAIEFVEELLQ